MAAPLEIAISAKKARTLAGEGITLLVKQRVAAELDMETVELNRCRTIVQLDGHSFSGADYVTLHRIHPLSEVGRRFHAPAGSAWTSELNLLHYSKPPAAGRHSISVSYRYGNSDDERVSSNTVEVEVTPAKLLNAEFRWFGESGARDVLGTLWTALDGDRAACFLQTAGKKDPSAVLTSVDLNLRVSNLEWQPHLAHLNDIASMHYERYVVWLEGGRLWWVTVSDEGRISDPASAEHGLGQGAEIVDPPLQRNEGGVNVVVKAGVEGIVMRVAADGHAHAERLELRAGPSLAAWTESEEPVLLSALDLLPASAPAIATATALDQWRGQGQLLGAVRNGGSVEVFARPLTQGSPARKLARFELDAATVGRLRTGALQIASFSASSRAAVLLALDDAWMVATPDRVFDQPRGALARALLAGSAYGLFFIDHAPDRGFIATRLGEPVPDVV